VLLLALFSVQVGGGPALKLLPEAALNPPLVGLTAQAKVPLGVTFVPFESVSVTVTVQVVPTPTVTIVLAQLTLAEVDLVFTVTLKALELLFP
jgi:hypothetical protein